MSIRSCPKTPICSFYVRPYLTPYSTMLHVYNYQFIHGHLIYGIHIYQQKRAIRIVANVDHIPYYLIRTNETCSQSRILPLPSLSICFICLYEYKVFNHLSSQYVSNIFASDESRFPKRDQKLLFTLDHLIFRYTK